MNLIIKTALTCTLAYSTFEPLVAQESSDETKEPESSEQSRFEKAENPESAGIEVEIMTVTGSRVQKTEVEDISKIEIPAEEAKLVAPNGDIAQIPKLLPGTLSRPAEPEVSIRGSDSRESLYYIDDIKVPFLFEPISGTSIVPNRAISSVAFYPGNFDSEWGNSTGGVIRLETRGEDIIESVTEIALKIPTYLTLYHESDLSDDSSMVLSFRKSSLEYLFAALPEDAFQGVVLVPSFQDAYLQHFYGGDTYSVKSRVIHARTNIKATFPDDEASDNSNFSQFDLDFGYDLVGVDFKTSVATIPIEFAPFYVYSDQTINGPTFSFDIRGGTLTLPLRAQFELSNTSNLFFGAEYELLDFKVTLNVPDTVAADNAEDPSSVENIFIDTTSKPRIFSTWLSYEQIIGNWLLAPSVRLYTNSLLKKDQIDPRFIGKYRLSQKDTITFGVGKYSAAPSIQQLSPEFGNPDLPWIDSTHYTVGWDATILGRFTNIIQAYYKEWKNLTNDDPVERFVPNTTKYSQGLEWFLRYSDGGPTFGWIAYTFSLTKKKIEGFDEVPDENDITHNLNLVANWKATDTFLIGGRVRYQTGYPYTPVENAVYQTVTDEYFPEEDPSLFNTARVPDTLSASIFAQNEIQYETWLLTLRYGVEDYQFFESSPNVVYNYDYSEQGFAMGIPAIPFFEIRGTF